MGDILKLWNDQMPERRAKNKTNIVLIYKVTLPSWIVWPGKVTVKITYTEAAAAQYIEDYPNRFLAMWMRIEPEEIITWDTD